MGIGFLDLKLREELVQGLQKAGIVEPTEIQAKVITLALNQLDIIGQSPTGTGKTLAYLLPVFQKIDPAKKEAQALILCPTHELSMQIYNQSQLLAANSGLGITALPIIGNANIARQIEKLKNKPQILVGSIGRIQELIQKKKITPHTIQTIIIDEADRMMDDRDLQAVRGVIQATLKKRQIMLFSATISQKAIEKAKEFMNQPKIIQVQETVRVAQNITHYYFMTEQREKIELLRKIVRGGQIERALVFLNKNDEIGLLVEKLNFMGIKAAGLHSHLDKMARKRALENFRDKKIQLLFATDIAARGLDISGVNYVFNFDMPNDPLSYVHRSGRTGRAGSSGLVFSFVTHRDQDLVQKIARELKITLDGKKVSGGKIIAL